jgi:GDP-L-fucose synthase
MWRKMSRITIRERSAGRLLLPVFVVAVAAFLGSHLVDTLEARGGRKRFIRRGGEYDLHREGDMIRVYDCVNPDITIHLAAAVGGIGANRAHPGQFFYDNLLMGPC